MKALNKVVGETGLVKVNVHIDGRDIPREMSAEKPFGGPHELNIDKVGENALELVFHISALGEEHKVINVETKNQRVWQSGFGIIRWVMDVAGINRWIVRVGSKSH